VTIDKQKSSNNEKASLEPTKESGDTYQTSSISKENLPSFNKILITDDGKDESNKVFNYAISLSRNSGAELLILRILENIEKMEDVSVQGSNEDNMGNKDMKREVKGEIIDEMEKKIKRCKEAGCENKISYKFKVGDAIEEIVNEVKEGNYDLIVLRSSHIDSWMKSLFSDARKIISNISIPVLIVQ
jgi:nucleotide-binding universal stress UspA family protein